MPTRSGFSRRDLLSMTGLVAGSGLVPRIVNSQEATPAASESPVVPGTGGTEETTGVLYEAKEGPWGSLNYYYFYLEAPAHLIEAFPLRNPRTRWAVPLQEETSLRAIIESAPMSDSQRRILADDQYVGVADGLYAIFPPSELLVGLNSEARGMIYSYLARFDSNPDIKHPVRIRSGSVEEWAKGTTIRPELVAQMKAMTYFRGDLMLFGDFPHIISQATSEKEARALQRHSSRVRSMVVGLNVKKSTSPDSILSYWTTGLGLRRKEVEPLVQAAVATPGVTSLSLAHMLPPLPRKLLYTYPDMSMGMDGVLPDCHWTALNFFNYNSEAIFLDEFFAASRLMSGFKQIEPPYRFGDALVFVTEEMNAHHSCIYLGADLVYTKNGRSLYAPWTILQLSEVKSTYPDFEGQPLRIQGYRRVEAV